VLHSVCLGLDRFRHAVLCQFFIAMTKDEKRPARTNSKGTSRLSRNRWLRYGPLVVWASLIFIGSGSVLSAEHTSVVLQIVKWFYPSASPTFLAWFHFLVRKAGHLTEYAILAMLAARAFRNSSHQFIKLHWFKLSLLLAVMYALTDEFHQSFVPSRTASLHDSLIDSAGALIALSVIWFRERRRVSPPGASG
jgi:VanZ family protein